MTLRETGHSTHDLKYHSVWCPKYRRLALKGNIGKYVSKIIYEVAERFDFSVLELAVMPNHVHMFVTAPPLCCLGDFDTTGKKHSAREVFNRFPAIKRLLWGGAFWKRDYFVMSSGTGTTDEMIRRYIKKQRN